MVNFIPLNVRSESSLAAILSHIDNATQYAENLEPKDPADEVNYDDDDDDELEDYDNSEYESNLDNID